MVLKSLTLPQSNPNWSLYAAKQKDWSTQIAIREGYNASAIVYSAVEKRAKLIASVPWQVKIKRNGELQDAPENHPLAVLLQRPNPDQSLYELMYEASQSLDLSGNAFISEIKAGARNLPTQLWLLSSKYMRIAPGREKLIDYFEYDNTGIKRRIDTEDMVQLRMPNPDDPYWGMPVLKAAGMAADVDREAAIFQKVSLQNRGLSDIAVKLPDGATQQQADQVRDALAKRNGTPANARAPIVSSGEVSQLNQTAAEMDFVNSRKANWAEIAAVFGVPLASLGFTENVNLANAKEMNRSLWQDTIIPQLELIKRQLNQQLAIEFGADVVISYDLSNVAALQEDLDKKLVNAESLWRMGVPFNVINQKLELGLDDIEGGDIGYLPTGVLPVGFESPAPEQQMTDDVKMAIHKLAYGGE